MQAVRIGFIGALMLSAVSAHLVAQQDAPSARPVPASIQGRDGEISAEAAGDRASRLTLKLKDRDLRDVVANIARKANVNIIMDEAIEEAVSIDLQDVHWRQALNLVAEKAGCVVVDSSPGVLKIEKPPRVFFAFENTEDRKSVV